jgi:arabinose-5-phosphate isomerase
LHPGEAQYGELGMVTSEDVLLLISNSGSTEELTCLLPYFRELGVPIIAMVGDSSSPIARAATAVLDISVDRETCPHNLVPTTSALSTLALGDALAMAAMMERQLTPDDLARVHPAGVLGQRSHRSVAEVMKSQDLPLASPSVSVREALLVMSAGRVGLVVVVSHACTPIGILTDGDLRRGIQSVPDLMHHTISEVMTRSPITIPMNASIAEANQRMRRLRIKALIVVDDSNRVVGVVEIFDE